MYSIEEAKELFSGEGSVKIKFRKLVKPLSIFEGLTVDDINMIDFESWSFPKSDIWLNVSIPSEDDFCKKLDISVGFTGDRYCVFIFLDILVGSRGYYSYNQFGTIEEVYRYILGTFREQGDPDVIEKYVEIE